MPDDLVTTPGGPRSRSLVHLIEDGTVLDGTNGRLRKLGGAGKVLTDFGVLRRRPAGVPLHPGNVTLPRTEVTPAFGSGWITYAWWSNATGTPVSSFATTWTVPEPPSTQSGQLIYLFSGIQNSTMIYQPVLQWGSNGAFGGNYWCVASWYVDGQGGPGFHSSPVPVNPGDTLVGVMALTGQSGSQFSYNCGFQGIADASLPISNVDELTWLIETLECYGITQCSDYPDAALTEMQDISIVNGGSNPPMNWTATNVVTDCGQHTVVGSNSSTAGIVELNYYGDQAHIIELRLEPGQWLWADLARIVSGPPAASAPFAYTSPDGAVRVVYQDTNGDIIEMYLAPGQPWQVDSLTGITGAPSAASAPRAYVTPDGTARVVYQDTNGPLIEMYLAPGQPWQQDNLSADISAPPAVGAPFGYVTTDGTARVVYQDTNGGITELYLAPGEPWQQDSLTDQTNALPPDGAPFAYVTPDKTARVIYQDSSGGITELYLAPGEPWQQDSLTAATGAPSAVGAPHAYVGPDGTARVVYQDSNGGITEIYLAPGQPWQQDSLTGITGAPTPASPPFGYTSPDGAARVVYQDSNNDVIEMFLAPGQPWQQDRLTAITGAPLAASAPFAYVTPDQLPRVYYSS